MSVTFFQPVEVKDLLKGPQRSKTLVIDVRDEDFAGGHIAGCVNFPVDNFDDKNEIDTFIETRVLPQGFDTVIVYCWMSQQRGPHCAKRLASRLQCMELDFPKVHVLSQGFKGFQQLYGDDSELIEMDEEDSQKENAPAQVDGSCFAHVLGDKLDLGPMPNYGTAA